MNGDFISRTDVTTDGKLTRYHAHIKLSPSRAKDREIMEKYGIKTRKQLKKMFKKAKVIERFTKEVAQCGE